MTASSHDFTSARDDLAALRNLGRRTRYDPANRLALLSIHVAFGLAVGGCFLIYGVPAGWKVSLGEHPATLTAIAVVPVAGGALLGLGLMLGRQLWLEALGMATMLGWELFGVGVVIRWIIKVDPGPLQYQVALYAAPALLMVVHLATLVAYLRDERRGRV